LKAAGEYLQAQKWGVVVISASAGMKGDTDKDLLLTQARAMVIRNYLVQNFSLEDKRIKTMGKGKTEDDSEGGKVEILIYPG
jgi:outer membrane protein OmpA-like peptidoglycan-associated protein